MQIQYLTFLDQIRGLDTFSTLYGIFWYHIRNLRHEFHPKSYSRKFSILPMLCSYCRAAAEISIFSTCNHATLYRMYIIILLYYLRILHKSILQSCFSLYFSAFLVNLEFGQQFSVITCFIYCYSVKYDFSSSHKVSTSFYFYLLA